MFNTLANKKKKTHTETFKRHKLQEKKCEAGVTIAVMVCLRNHVHVYNGNDYKILSLNGQFSKQIKDFWLFTMPMEKIMFSFAIYTD